MSASIPKRPRLQITPFVPPKRKPGDHPCMYGNDVPQSYIRELEAKHFDPLKTADERTIAYIRETKEQKAKPDIDDEDYGDYDFSITPEESPALTQEEIDDGWRI